MMMGLGGNSFLQIGSIYNGFLVHYEVAVARNQFKIGTAGSLTQDLKEAIKGKVEKELGIKPDRFLPFVIDNRSVYCSGKDEIAKVVVDAMMEQERIKTLREEGKIGFGFQYLAGGDMSEYVTSADLVVGDPPPESSDIT
jgi:hypothetical protein